MTPPNDGGPAFPEAGLAGLPNGEFIHGRSGMSLRDHFSGLALAAMIGNPNKDGANRGKSGVPVLAGFAYEYADAMLKVRSEPPIL